MGGRLSRVEAEYYFCVDNMDNHKMSVASPRRHFAQANILSLGGRVSMIVWGPLMAGQQDQSSSPINIAIQTAGLPCNTSLPTFSSQPLFPSLGTTLNVTLYAGDWAESRNKEKTE